jgi:hypothetical protein
MVRNDWKLPCEVALIASVATETASMIEGIADSKMMIEGFIESG